MRRADALARLGLFVSEELLDNETCERLIADVRSTERAAAGVYHGSETIGTDAETRQTRRALVAPASVALVKERLLPVKPELERFFALSLTDCQEPQFLVYESGDFFLGHTDASESGPAYAVARKISAIVFLNSQSPGAEPGTYSGGSLVFSGLLPGMSDLDRGIGIAGQRGSLLAFRSTVVHEVKPVTSGERYTVVTWFY
jgi:SM-20-related protein